MIARYYIAEKNPDNGHLPGAPLRDLTEEEFSALPEWLQRSVDALPFYRKTKPGDAPRATTKPEKET
jgi:hypothetical protein